MQIKLKNQNEDGKFQEVHFEGYPDGKDYFEYLKDIKPHVDFLQRSGIVTDEIKIVMDTGYDKKLSERGPEKIKNLTAKDLLSNVTIVQHDTTRNWVDEYTAIDQEYEEECVKIPKSKIKYVNVYKEPHGFEIGSKYNTEKQAIGTGKFDSTYFKTIKIIDE